MIKKKIESERGTKEQKQEGLQWERESKSERKRGEGEEEGAKILTNAHSLKKFSPDTRGPYPVESRMAQKTHTRTHAHTRHLLSH